MYSKRGLVPLSFPDNKSIMEIIDELLSAHGEKDRPEGVI
jgi:hypothetical protein